MGDTQMDPKFRPTLVAVHSALNALSQAAYLYMLEQKEDPASMEKAKDTLIRHHVAQREEIKQKRIYGDRQQLRADSLDLALERMNTILGEATKTRAEQLDLAADYLEDQMHAPAWMSAISALRGEAERVRE